MSMLSTPPPSGAAEAPAEIDPLAEVVEQDAVADAAVQRPVSRNGLVWRRLKRKPNFWIGGGITLAIILFALFGNIPNIYAVGQQDPYGFNAAPGAQHWFGADAIGIDLYASITAALRKSLLIGFIAAPPAATIIAALIGSLAGYLGGPLELFHGWLVNLLLVLPVFYVLMIISPPLLSSMSWMVLVVAIALFGWMIMSQIVKNQTKSLREREFVLAARFTGVGTFRILTRHIIPNVSSLLIVDATLGVCSAILAETSLSYFGWASSRRTSPWAPCCRTAPRRRSPAPPGCSSSPPPRSWSSC